MDSTVIDHVGMETEEHPIQIEPWSFLPNIQYGMVGHINSTITELELTRIKTKTNELDIHSPSAALIHGGEKTYFYNNYGKKFTSTLQNQQFSHTRNSTEIDNVEVKIEEYPINIEPWSFQPITENGMVAPSNSSISIELEMYKNETQTTEKLDNHNPCTAPIHAGRKAYYCNHCGKNFTTNTLLQKHQFIHSRNKKLNQCSLSFKSYAKNDLFKINQRKHTGEKPFKCSLCDKAFSLKCNLVTHQTVHTGEKSFHCNYGNCDKSFARKCTLVVHERIHTGEKPYNCHHCDKAFASKAKNVEHQRTHTGEKPFQCSHCDISFAKKGTLVLHQRRHTGEKPYNCNNCDKAFSHKSNLNKHHRNKRCK